MRHYPMRTWWLRVITIVAFAASAAIMCNPPQPARAQQTQKYTSCTPIEQLRQSPNKRDTLLAMLPCNDLAQLYPPFREQVECTLDRLRKGGWDPIVYETYRSDDRQQFLYSYGRTRPGPRVTNAKDATKSQHGSGFGTDIIHRTKFWNHPRFFYWVGQHAEACKAVAGAFWKKLPDFPHIQFGLYQGAPPLWIQRMRRAGISNDSIWRMHARHDSLALSVQR